MMHWNAGKFSASIFTVLLLLAPAGAQAVRVEPGQWELRLERSGAVGDGAKENTLIQCFTAGEYDPATVVRFLAGDCALHDLEADGDTVTWSMQCAGAGPDKRAVAGDGIFISAGEIVRGEIIMSLPWRGRTLRQESSLRGRRIGTGCE